MTKKRWVGKRLLDAAASLPGHLLAKFITQEISGYQTFSVHDADTLAEVIKPRDFDLSPYFTPILLLVCIGRTYTQLGKRQHLVTYV